jgi:enamine deaminase RidA (YjgF/YER057c/UK114 family)
VKRVIQASERQSSQRVVMSESSKPQQETADSETSKAPPADGICYRMQPAKQMLGCEPDHCSAPSCVQHGAAVSLPGENKMPPCLLSDQQHSVIDLDRVTRVALMVTPQRSASAIDEAWEAVSTIRVILQQQSVPMTLTKQAVFVRSADDIESFRQLFRAYFGDRMPATSFIVQPPCGGQALAIEAWALGGEGVEVQFPATDVVTIEYDGLRWIYAAGISSPVGAKTAYEEAELAFRELADRLQAAGSSFQDVPRIWLYQGGITETESNDAGEPIERYRELNRARTDFFERLEAEGQMTVSREGKVCYPASTGIGMAGRGLTISCMGLQTQRDDVVLQSLENPGQTSAFDYAKRFSLKSPKFSRAMAVKIGNYVTNWVSGTASILDSETVHVGDVEKQTEQTIDNIERLISNDNLTRHGLPGAGAQLSDLAKVRVYVKHLEDYETCRAVCQRRLGSLPIIYALAEVCRPDLLVEIEGVAFSTVDS